MLFDVRKYEVIVKQKDCEFKNIMQMYVLFHVIKPPFKAWCTSIDDYTDWAIVTDMFLPSFADNDICRIVVILLPRFSLVFKLKQETNVFFFCVCYEKQALVAGAW
jgi:hypothetical protein